MRDIPNQAIELVKKFEGLRLQRYLDSVGLPTIGYGHLLNKSDKIFIISPDQADGLLMDDLYKAHKGVLNNTKVTLNDNQLSALISFVFNLGIMRYKASSLRSCLNRGEYHNAPSEIIKWVYAGTKKLPGLVIRRNAEARLFMTL